jgi:ribosomal protein L24E
MAATPDGQGYWLVASDGGIFAFGDSGFHGSTGGLQINAPITGIQSSPTGLGYWLVSRDGGIFAFGDAHYYGSAGDLHLQSPTVAIS